MPISNDKFIAMVGNKTFSDLWEANLTLDSEVKPKALPCRELPLAVQDNVKRNRRAGRGVLAPLSEPTWVSQIAVPRKPNGKITTAEHCTYGLHCKLPTLNDVPAKLNNAKIFSKLESEKLTGMSDKIKSRVNNY